MSINVLVWRLMIAMLIVLPGSLISQEWKSVINDQNTYEEITRKVDSFYQSDQNRAGLDYKFYRRWQHHADLRFTENSPIVNISAQNYGAYRRQFELQSFERATHGQWEELGPFDYNVNDVYSNGGVGRVNCTAFHPTQSNTMWVGTAGGGIWKTTNGGSTWQPMTDGFASISITDIVVDNSDPNTLYALTGDGDASPPVASIIGSAFPGTKSIGVLKSIDGGVTWSPTGLTFGVSASVYAYKMISHPVSSDTLFVAMKGGGIFKTTDAGATWTQTLSGDVVWDIEFKPGAPEQMYATTNNGFKRSLDGGGSWFLDDDPNFPTSFSRAEIAICPSLPSRVYVVFGGSTNVGGTFQGLFLSTNSGTSFSTKSTTPNILGSSETGGSATDQAWYDLTILVDPTNAARVFVGGVNMWKSEDSGSTWERKTINYRVGALGAYVHADWHEMYFQSGRLYANVDGGIYYSDNLGTDWTEITSGLSIMQFYEIDILNNKYMGGTQDNGTNEAELTNSQCSQILGADGFGCKWHTSNNTIQYISTQNAIYRRQFGIPSVISPIDLGNGDYWFTELEMHTTDADYVFVTSNPSVLGQQELYRGDGNATEFSWDDLGLSELGDGVIRNFVQGVSQDNVMYVATSELLIKTSNLSATEPTWTPSNLTFYSEGRTPTDVETSPSNSDQVWVTVNGYTSGNKVWYSSNGGSQWTNITANLPNVLMNCLTYDPSNETIYVGTDIGVYARGPNSTDWIFFSNFLPNVMVTDMELRPGFLYAGTYGRGIWRTPIYSACPTNLNLTAGNDTGNPFSPGQQQYSASNSLSSSRSYIGDNGTDIRYRAGNYIDLKPGFESTIGSLFLAKIDGCPD